MVAVEVAEMETTIQYLRDQVRDLELTNRALEVENAMYEGRCISAEENAANELVRSTEMRQLLSNMSAMLVEGLAKIERAIVRERDERREREARRLEQEQALEVGGDDAPLFLLKTQPPPVTAPSEVPQSSALLPAAQFSDLETDLHHLAQLGETK